MGDRQKQCVVKKNIVKCRHTKNPFRAAVSLLLQHEWLCPNFTIWPNGRKTNSAKQYQPFEVAGTSCSVRTWMKCLWLRDISRRNSQIAFVSKEKNCFVSAKTFDEKQINNCIFVFKGPCLCLEIHSFLFVALGFRGHYALFYPRYAEQGPI